MGARVFAVASGSDGVALVNKLGANAVVDGHKDDIAAAARQFASNGLDVALITAGGTCDRQGPHGNARGRMRSHPERCRT